MLADPMLLVRPIHELTELLSASPGVPAPVRDVMAPASAALGAAEQLLPSLTRLADSSWQALSALGATESMAAVGVTIDALLTSAGQIAGIVGQAAEVVVRGTAEIVGLAESFLAQTAALGPALVTPPGQAAALGLAAEHLARAIAVVERVQAELAPLSARLRVIAATLADAPAAPGVLAAAGAAGTPGAVIPGAASAAALEAAPSGDLATGGDPVAGSAAGPAGTEATAAALGSPAVASAATVGGAGSEVTLPDGSVVTAPNATAAQAVRNALTQQGVPYVWGGNTPGVGLDCSGFTKWAYGEAGIDLPRLAQEQDVGAAVPADQLMPGDLAVWDGHVAMYVGNDQLIEAGDPISISPLRTTNSGMSFFGFFRPSEQ